MTLRRRLPAILCGLKDTTWSHYDDRVSTPGQRDSYVEPPVGPPVHLGMVLSSKEHPGSALYPGMANQWHACQHEDDPSRRRQDRARLRLDDNVLRK
ncbi:hypothetical protein TNCV_951571 [Trichonephila clavipes]|nr:hypothetical protein TNCV_951571 [Trichonephila clavipes]